MIRHARPRDAAALARVYLEVWKANGQDLMQTPEKPAESGEDEQAASAASPSNALPPNAFEEQKKRFEEFLLGEKRHFIVAEGVPGRVCGFVSYGQSYTRDTWGEVMQLYVHPVWQRQGLGSQLLNGATRSMEACEWAIGGLHVWCTKGNAANSVYERNGWVTTGREKEIKPTLSSVIVPVVEYISPNAALELEVLREMREQKSGIDPVFKALCASMVLALAMMIPAFWKMRPGGSLHTLAFPEVEPPRDVGDRVVVNPLEVGIPSARCLDGSWPSYYHRRPGGPTGANSWLLHFEGGGWCRPNAAGEGDETSLPFPPALARWCTEQLDTPQGSTKSDPETRDFSTTPLFSTDPLQNPMFHDWQVVLVRHCDGSAFASAAGVANFRAVLRHLTRRQGLEDASDVVVSGCGVGAIAAALHVQAVKRAVPEATVGALLDSGVFPDWSRQRPADVAGEAAPGYAPRGLWPMDAQVKLIFEGHGVASAGAVPQDCLRAHPGAAWRCYFLEHLLPFVSVPAFVAQSRFDSSNVEDRGVEDGLEALSDAMAWRLDVAAHQGSEHHALFLDSCFHHCMSWGQIHAGPGGETSGPTQPEAFSAWWWDLVRPQQKREEPAAANPRRRWDHIYAPEPEDDEPNGPGIGTRPCIIESCCARAGEHLRDWRRTFSGEVLGKAAARARRSDPPWLCNVVVPPARCPIPLEKTSRSSKVRG